MPEEIKKKPISWKNLGIGAFIQVFEVSTLGQPFEVVKTQMAANKDQGLVKAIQTIHKSAGITGFWRGLIPWAWIEASTKGGVLLFTSSEIEYVVRSKLGLSNSAAGILGGAGGGFFQAYTTMGFCTFMKTVEVTRHRSGAEASTMKVAADIFKREGIRGINKGVNAVALRQMTNWGSRMGISRIVESALHSLKDPKDKDKALSKPQRLLASVIGGTLACWNQPIEVIRVNMQSQVLDATRPAKMTIANCAKWIWEQQGFKGFYRGVTPRIGLSVYLTSCMVFGGDELKAYFAKK